MCIVFVGVVSDVVFTSAMTTDVTTSQYHDVAVYSSSQPLSAGIYRIIDD